MHLAEHGDSGSPCGPTLRSVRSPSGVRLAPAASSIPLCATPSSGGRQSACKIIEGKGARPATRSACPPRTSPAVQERSSASRPSRHCLGTGKAFRTSLAADHRARRCSDVSEPPLTLSRRGPDRLGERHARWPTTWASDLRLPAASVNCDPAGSHHDISGESEGPDNGDDPCRGWRRRGWCLFVGQQPHVSIRDQQLFHGSFAVDRCHELRCWRRLGM